MKEVIKHLDWVGYPGYSISSLGYVLNRKMGTVLFSKVKSGQIALTNDIGQRVYTQLRTLVAEHFDVPGEGQFVWHLDNNPYNCAVANLVRTPKRGHKARSVYAALRLFAAGKSDQEVEDFTKLGLPFVEALRAWQMAPQYDWLQLVTQKWVDDRLELFANYGLMTPEGQYVGGAEINLVDGILLKELELVDSIDYAVFFTVDEAKDY